MSDKNKGLYHKYNVTKLSNPNKVVDCIVLEFDDPIARIGIEAWAVAMEEAGYDALASDVADKLVEYENL